MLPLRRVLCAFACDSPSVGYCQGLNYIAALLLIVTRDEDKVDVLSPVIGKLYEQSVVVTATEPANSS